MYLVKFSISGLLVAIYLLVTHEGEKLNYYALFFVFLFLIIIINKLPGYFRDKAIAKARKQNNAPQESE